MVNDLTAKISRIKLNLEIGGDNAAMQLGEDLGDLAWQVGSIGAGAVGGAKALSALAKAGATAGKAGTEILSNLSNLEKRVGASGIGPWGKGVTNVVDGGTFTQCGNGSCVSATAQLLTKGAITEQQALAQLGEWTNPLNLPAVLNKLTPNATPWIGGYFDTPSDALIIARRGEFGAVLQVPMTGSHMVTIMPIKGSTEMFRVFDTGVGKTYDVTASWIKTYVSGGVWKK